MTPSAPAASPTTTPATCATLPLLDHCLITCVEHLFMCSSRLPVLPESTPAAGAQLPLLCGHIIITCVCYVFRIARIPVDAACVGFLAPD
jgi:hypothetical protein